MTIGVRPRYYCTNASACTHARANRVFDQATFSAHGRCIGSGTDGCGGTLVAGDPLDQRGRIFFTLMTLIALTWYLIPLLFPAPLSGVTFIGADTRVTQGNAQTLQVMIERSTDLAHGCKVTYRTTEGSAKAQQDFAPASGKVEFAPGEKRKAIEIRILAGNAENAKNFFLELSNVRDTPHHSITLEPPKGDPAIVAKAGVLVRGASNLAMDIADLYLRIEHGNLILASGKLGIANKKLIREALDEQEARLNQATQRYVQMLNDLSQLDPVNVRISFEQLQDILHKKAMDQQAKVTEVAQKHHDDLRKGQVPRPDFWALQLSRAIPHPGSGKTTAKEL